MTNLLIKMRISFLVLLLVMASNISQAEKKLRIAVDSLPPYLGHPFGSTARPTSFTNSAIFDGLIQFDKEGNIFPRLALQWENIDTKTWRFTLRNNVFFSNGTKLTSESLKATVDWLSSDESLRDGVRTEIPFLETARIVDDLTVDIITKIPVPEMPRYAGSLLLIEPKLFKKQGRQKYSENPIGTGPFKLKKWGSSIIEMDANTKSWRPPKVDKLEIKALPNPSGRLQALMSNSADVSTGLGPDDIYIVESSGGIMETWLDASVAAISFVTINDGPIGNYKVRQALNYAVNKQAIIDALLGGLTKPASQGISQNAYGYNEELKPYPYDPVLAKSLLKEAGYEGGFTFQFITQTGSGANSLIFQQIASDLSKVGVKMIIKQMPAPAYLRAVLRDPNHAGADAHSLVWPAWPTFDALRALQTHSCNRSAPWHCDRKLQPLIDQAFVEWDRDKGLRLRKQLMKLTRDSAPAIFLFESPEFTGLSKNVRGYYQFYGFIAYDQIDLIN